jgi:ParB-like chromosome segregation protein Spo0J/Ca2+-binding EF-hand superfamily protein
MIVELEIKDLTIPQGLLPRVLTGTVEERVEEYKEMLEQGVEFDPITVWKRPDGQYWVVDGVHRTEAHKRAGRTTIKAKIVELKDELEYRLEAIRLNIKHGLPLQKEEKILLAQTLYKLGVQTAELKKIFGVAERTLYYWLEPIKEKEKEELRQKALELRKQGLTQEEVAERLGVSQMTISRWESEGLNNFAKIAKTFIANNSQLLSPDGTPTIEGFKVLSEFIEEHEEELKQKPFNEVVKDQTLRDVLKFLHEAIKRDLRRFIDSPTYEKAKNYLITIYPYKELSLKARKVFFDKAQALWEKLKKEYEEEKKLEREVLEEAKKILANQEYVFHTWRTLREDLARLGNMNHTFVYAKKEEIDAILHRHADELMEIYRAIPEATSDSLSEEELIEIKEKVEGEVDKWRRMGKIREEVKRMLKERGLRWAFTVEEGFINRAEELLKEEAKPTIDREKLEQIAEEIERETPEEQWEALRQEFEKTKEQKKAREKKEKTLPPDIEEWYREELEELLLDMGIKLGWVRTFEITDEIYQKVKEFSKKAVRGW